MTILAFLPCPMWLADRPLVGMENLWVKDHKGSISPRVQRLGLGRNRCSLHAPL